MGALTIKGQSRASVLASFPMARIIAERAMRARKGRSSVRASAPDQRYSASQADRSMAGSKLGLAAAVLCSLVSLAVVILVVLQLWVLVPVPVSPPVPQAADENCGNVESDVPTVPDIRGTPARLGPAFTC